MKTRILHCALAAALSLPAIAGNATSDAAIAAHRAALDLSGAFANDGFKLRDGNLSGELKPGQSVLVQVNLYAGNQYWFAVATADDKASLGVALFDEAGKSVDTEHFTTQADTSAKAAAKDADPDAAATNRSAAGFAPDASGPYYVSVSNTTSAPATYCLIYSYK